MEQHDSCLQKETCKVKLLKGDVFEVDVLRGDLISVVKKKVAATNTEFGAASTMKLIFGGRLLEDNIRYLEVQNQRHRCSCGVVLALIVR